MKVAIVGSRKVNPTGEMFALNIPAGVTQIITGGAIGADQAGEKYARKNKIPVEVIKPDYKKYGKAAPHVRNAEIFQKADFIVFFWDGLSRGTLSVLKMAEKKGKPFRLVKI